MKRIATTISIVATIAIACDVPDREERVSSHRAVLPLSDEFGTSNAIDPDEEESRRRVEDEDPEESTIASDVEREVGGIPAPTGPTELGADIHPLGAPTCGAFPTTALGGCVLERVDDTSGTFAAHVCTSGRIAVGGSCFTASSSHKLIRHFATSASLNDLVDDGQTPRGWSCEWDTSASMTNTHHVAVYCCTGSIVATCP